VRFGDFSEHLTALRVRPGKIPMAERAICCDGDPVTFTPWQHRVLNGAFLQVIRHLIAGKSTLALPGNGQGFFEVGHVEIADAPGEDLACALKVLEACIVSSSGCRPRQCSR